MICRHRKILFEWLQELQELDDEYIAECQDCGAKFDVVWIERGEPSLETNWEWGAVLGIELYKEEDD
jgi:hypothetical protein